MPNWVVIGPQLESAWRPRMLEGHCDLVTSVAISCRGDRLASTSWDKTIRVWDASSGVCTIICKVLYNGAAFSPLDNDTLAAYRGYDIMIWDVLKGENTKKIMTTKGGYIKSISLSPRSKNILASLSRDFIELWNTDTCETVWRRPGSAEHLAFATHADLLAWSSCGSDGSVEILDLPTKTIIHHRDFNTPITGYSKGIFFSSKCVLLTVLSNRGRISLWDSVMNRMIVALQYNEEKPWDYITSFCFSADSSLLATSGYKSGIRIWETVSGILVKKIAIEACGSMTFSADKKQLFACLYTHKIFVLSVTGEDNILPTDLERAGGYGRAKFSPDTRLFTRNYGDQFILWDSISQTSTTILSVHDLVLSADSTRVACSRNLNLQIWSIDSSPPKVLFEKRFARSMATLSQDMKQVAMASKRGTISIWNTSSGKRLWQLKEADVENMVLLFSWDGKSLAAVCFEPWTLGIWDLVSGTRTTTTFENISSPGSFHSFIAFNSSIYHLKSLPGPDETFDNIFDPHNIVRDMGLPANRSSYSMAEGNDWVTHNEKRVLWLPPRYRPAYWTQWDANDRFIGIHTHRALILEFCCTMCSAKVTNKSNEIKPCRQDLVGKYRNIKEPEPTSADGLKAMLGRYKTRLLDR